MRAMVCDIGLCRPWLALENPDKEEAAGVVRSSTCCTSEALMCGEGLVRADVVEKLLLD